jgi:predicted acylesterase/phospholipase RssA
MATTKKRITFILPGGGMKGVFQISVLNELLHDWGDSVEIRHIYGCSVGAIIAPLVCVRKTADALSIIGDIQNVTDVFESYGCTPAFCAPWRLLCRPSVFRRVKLVDTMKGLLSKEEWEQAESKCSVVAWNATDRCEEWFTSAELDLGIRASSALWLAVEPVQWRGKLLCDGCVTELIPCTPLMSAKSDSYDENDIVVLVDCDSRDPSRKPPASACRSGMEVILSLQEAGIEQLGKREEEAFERVWKDIFPKSRIVVIRPSKDFLTSGIDMDIHRREAMIHQGVFIAQHFLKMERQNM